MSNSLTLALTGHLPFILIAAAVLTWPISVFLLAVYGRAQRRSMRRVAHGHGQSQASRDVSMPASSLAPIEVAIVEVASATAAQSPPAATLAQQLVRGPWQVATCYGLAGLVYALVLTTALLIATHIEFLPLRFATLVWIFAWPAVLSVGIVAGSVRRTKLVIALAYAAIFLGLGVPAVEMSPDLTFQQLLMLWVLYNGPPVALLMICLHRRIRAVGPLVLSFLLLALLGADLLLALVGTQERYMRWAVTAAGAIGAGGTGAFLATIGVGFLLFGVIGWTAVSLIRKRYEAKQISDESLTLDALWLLFTVGHGVGLAFEGPFAVLGGVAAFGAYKVTVRLLLSRHRRSPEELSPQLLLLRSFSIGHSAERLFDALEKHWRRAGSIQMIAGYDLAARTIEPHEFLDFLTGKLARRFIDDESTLQRRTAEKDTRPDRDGRFRVNDFYCYDDTWRMTFSSLAHSSNVVLMDLRGFSELNTGCVFEIRELFATVDLAQVVFVVDGRTDEAFLRRTFNDAALLASIRSPGLKLDAITPRVFRLGALDAPTLRSLLAALSAAASARTVPSLVVL